MTQPSMHGTLPTLSQSLLKVTLDHPAEPPTHQETLTLEFSESVPLHQLMPLLHSVPVDHPTSTPKSQTSLLQEIKSSLLVLPVTPLVLPCLVHPWLAHTLLDSSVSSSPKTRMPTMLPSRESSKTQLIVTCHQVVKPVTVLRTPYSPTTPSGMDVSMPSRLSNLTCKMYLMTTFVFAQIIFDFIPSSKYLNKI